MSVCVSASCAHDRREQVDGKDVLAGAAVLGRSAYPTIVSMSSSRCICRINKKWNGKLTSAAMTSTALSTSTARRVISREFPIGVGTKYRDPGFDGSTAGGALSAVLHTRRWEEERHGGRRSRMRGAKPSGRMVLLKGFAVICRCGDHEHEAREKTTCI